MTIPPVLFVTMQTGAQANGGVESLTQLVVNAQRIRPILLTNVETERTALWRSAGLETHILPLGFSPGDSLRADPGRHLRAYAAYAAEARRLIADSGATLVSANDPLSMQLMLAPVRTRRAARLAFIVRGTSAPSHPPSRLKYGLLFRQADHTFFLSREMAAHWAPYAPCLTSRSSVTYSAVDPRRFHPGAPGARGGPPTVLVAGVLRQLKGQLEFLRHVAPALVSAGARVVLAGDYRPDSDAYAAACARAAAPLGSGVCFLGYRADMADVIRSADVVAVPSFHEGLVRVMIEAMACARPVVSFDVCSAREVLEMEAPGAGVVVRAGDYQGMAEALIRYCRDSASSAAAGAAGLAGAQRLFDPQSVVARYETVLARLAAPGPTGDLRRENRPCAA